MDDRESFLQAVNTRQDHLQTYSSPEGRRVLKNLIMSTHFLETTIHGKPDAATYTREANKRQVYVLLELIPALVGDVLREILQEWDNHLSYSWNKELSDG